MTFSMNRPLPPKCSQGKPLNKVPVGEGANRKADSGIYTSELVKLEDLFTQI